MAAAGRLTVAMYTTRHIQEGEELTFDYSAVTESEKEFRAATCLCGAWCGFDCGVVLIVVWFDCGDALFVLYRYCSGYDSWY